MLCILIWALTGRGESLCFMKQDHNLVMVTTIQTHTIRSSASDRKFYSSKGYQLDSPVTTTWDYNTPNPTWILISNLSAGVVDTIGDRYYTRMRIRFCKRLRLWTGTETI